MISLVLLLLQQFPSTMPDAWSTQDTTNVALVVIPLAALCFGFGVGSSFTKWACFSLYREHCRKHFFSTHGDAMCIYCREERGLRG